MSPIDFGILTTIGLIIILAYLGSRGLQLLGAPQVVGYILVGVLLGSSFLNIVPMPLVNELGIISEIALGLIGFEMGSRLRLSELRRMGRTIMFILVGEAFGAFILVALSVYWITGSDYTALIFAALATATAPAATVDVLSEYKAEGSLTTTLLAVVGLDDALALLLFSITAAFTEVLLSHTGGISIVQMIGLPFQEIFGALVIGIGVGLPFQWMLERLKSREHAVCAFIVGTVLLVAGLASSIGASLILATMTLGILMANVITDNSEFAHCAVERVGPLAYILFFVLVGAHVQISLLPQMGLLGIVYILMRSTGKFGGAWLGGWVGGAQNKVRDNLGFGLLSQAGVAIGLALSIAGRFNAYGEAGIQLGQTVINVITATTFVVQIAGPIMVKFAITRAREVGIAS
jgi:Kef-type K+ transport system membrane component KefB